MLITNTYDIDNKTLSHNGLEYPFYIGYKPDVRLDIALEILEFSSGNKTLQEVVENINQFKEK